MWNRTWQTYSSATQLVEPKNWSADEKNHTFANDVRVDYFSLLHCSISKTKPYRHSLVVWAKSIATNLTYCKIFENFMGSYLMCTCFWNGKGATKASLLIHCQRNTCAGVKFRVTTFVPLGLLWFDLSLFMCINIYIKDTIYS